MSYSHFRQSEITTRIPIDMHGDLANLESETFYLKLSESEVRTRIMPYFPEGLPVLVLSDNPSIYVRADGVRFWLLDSRKMNQHQLGMLLDVYRMTGTERQISRWSMPNGEQYVRNLIVENKNPPVILIGTDFGVNVELVEQDENWLLHSLDKPQVSPKKTTRRTTVKKTSIETEL